MISQSYGPSIIAGGVLVVFDDASRIRWRRLRSDAWTLDGTWPDKAEKAAVDAHLSQGGCLLVITNGQDIVTSAWPHELTEATAAATSTATATAEPDIASDEVIEVRLEHFDWLPADLRLRGDRFVAKERIRWEREPAILRPALTLDGDGGFNELGQVVFAMTSAASSRTWIEREIVHYLEQVEAVSGAVSV